MTGKKRVLMKKIFAIISLAALMMPVSCMKDELAGPETGINPGKTMTFTAVMEGAATKTSINEQTGAVAWAVGDAIKFDYAIGKTDSEPVVSAPLAEGDIQNGYASFKAGVPTEFALTEEEYAATFEEGVEAPKRYMYVAYPATVSTTYATAGTAYNVYIPAEQDGSFANASIALAKWDKLNPTAPLGFKNLCGLIQITVGDNVRQIKLTSSDYIAGRANIGFNDENAPYVKNMVEAEASKSVTVNVEAAGTYYIAVAPGTFADFCLAIYNEDGKLLADKAAKSHGSVAVDRGHILPLGLPEENTFVTGPEGSYFVTPEGRGTGDGSSWNNAASYATFVAYGAKATTIENAYLSEGSYPTTMKAFSNGVGFNIYGGYPADAICCDLSRRDIEKYPSVFDSEGSSGHRLWNIRNGGTWRVDGFTFKNFSHSEGGVISVSDASTIICKNCSFQNCTGTRLAGAVYFGGLTSTASLFENCTFLNNRCDATTGSEGGFGGAVGAFGTAGASAGLVTFKKCLFKGNSTKYAGGAVASRITSMRFSECNFIDNTGGQATNYIERSSILYTDASAVDMSFYCDGCYFANSNTVSNTHSSMISNHSSRENVSICINNSVLSGHWGYGNVHPVANTGNGKILISNSTLISQVGAVVYNKSTGLVNVVNSIILNASSGMISCKSETDAVAITLNNSLCSATTTATSTNCALNLNIRTNAAEDVKFPVNDSWNSGDAAKMRQDNHTTAASVTDCRGKVYYYAWDGTYPSGVTFTPTTLENVTTLVNTADANFATWLGDSLGKDIRGVSRDADSMWPGSYQK